MPSELARRQLGKRLRFERESRKIKVEAVELAGICSRVTLWRIENGKRATTDGEIWSLTMLYGSDHRVVNQLLEMAAATRGRRTPVDDGVSAAWTSTYFDLERSFSHMSVWHSWLIHALLQTDGYARAVASTDNASEEVIAQRLKRRTERQQHALGRADRTISLVLAEAVFTQLHLGEQVMKEQYDYLVACDRLDGVDIRILPATTGLHPGIRGPFSIMDFDDEADPAVVYIEDLTGARYLDQDKHVSPYRSAFLQLKDLSVPIKEYDQS